MKRKRCRLGRNMVFAVIVLACISLYWVRSAEKHAHYMPDYPMEDISVYLEKRELREEDYERLYQQTGLGRAAADTLLNQGREDVILAAQRRFFAEIEVVCERDFLLYNEVQVQKEMVSASASSKMGLANVSSFIPVLEDGDILITFSCHFLGWRNGHAAIVLDAKKGLLLEAVSMGRNSEVRSLGNWSRRPSYAVLRLQGVSEELRGKVAEYAEEKLVGIPYQLTAGLWNEHILTAMRSVLKLETDALPGTNCSHLIWYAYEQFGYDLDGDGGWLVTPEDLYKSPLLEVVQVYGMEPR